MEISAVIPTHDRPELLDRAIASVRGQTFPVKEIVVVDDASDPPVRTDSDVVVVRFEESVGPAAARNAGAARAEGSHVAFLDDDDIWLDRKLEKLDAAMADHPQAGAIFHRLASCSALPQTEDGFVVLENAVARMLSPHPPHPSTLVVRRDVHLEVEFDASYEAAADLDYNVRLAAATPVIEVFESLSCNHPREDAPTAIGIERRIRARERFRAQHAGLFTEETFVRHHEMQLAHLYRRAGRRGEALRRFASLARAEPADAAAWKGVVGSLIPLELAIRFGSRRQSARRQA